MGTGDLSNRPSPFQAAIWSPGPSLVFAVAVAFVPRQVAGWMEVVACSCLIGVPKVSIAENPEMAFFH